MIGVKFCWAEFPLEDKEVKAKCIAYIRNSKNGHTLYAGAVYKGKKSELKSFRKSLRYTSLYRLINRPIFCITPCNEIDLSKYKRFMKKLPNQNNKFLSEKSKKTQIIQNFLLTYEAEKVGLKSNKNIIEISKTKIINIEGIIKVQLGNELCEGKITPVSNTYSINSYIIDLLKSSGTKIQNSTEEFEDILKECNVIDILNQSYESLNKIGISFKKEQSKYCTRINNGIIIKYPRNLKRLEQPPCTRTMWMQLSNKKIACIIYDYTPSINLLIYTGCISPYHENISKIEKTHIYNIAVRRYYKKPVIIKINTDNFIKELGNAISLYGVKNYIEDYEEENMSLFKKTLFNIAYPIIGIIEYFLK